MVFSLPTEQQKNFVIKVLFYAAAVLLGYIALRLLSGPLFPFAAAAALTVSLQGILRKWVKKFRLKKKPASVALILAVYTVIIGLAVWLIRALYLQLTELIGRLPEYADSISAAVNGITHKINSFFGKMPDIGNGLFEDIPTAALGTVAQRAAEWITETAANVAAGIPQFLLSLAVMIIAGAYIAKDYDEISDFILKTLPENGACKLLFIKDTVLKKLAKLLKGYLIIIVMTFSELFLGLALIKVDYALIIAAVTALVDILPVLGSGTVLIPWAVFCALTGDTSRAVGLAVLYVAITAVRNVAEPKIIGSKLGIHPVLSLASVFIGLNLFGAVGVIIAPLAAVAVKSIIESRCQNRSKQSKVRQA